MHEAVSMDGANRSAVKVHHSFNTYINEREAYRRLRGALVNQILSLNVPQLLDCDDRLLVIEMTIVTKPFLLDFAGATLDHRTEFPPAVQKIISELEAFGIYLNDVSPSNIAWE